MNLGRALRALIPEGARRRIKVRLGAPDMEHALERLRANGFAPRAALDIGAYEGEWAGMCRRVWPACHVLMVEPQASKRSALEATVRRLGAGVDVRTALLGATPRENVPFFVNETVSSVLQESVDKSAPAVHVAMSTVDDVVAGTEFAAPDFIKLDVQGYELEVLHGGSGSVAAAEVILMEVNLIPIYDGAPLLAETVSFMAERGFRAYDICAFTRRPLDGALWQTDLIFVRDTSRLVASRAWQ